MGDIRLFHLISGGAHELPSNPVAYERDLQDIFQKHLRALTGIDFLAAEYSTGQRHRRRIDSLGIDAAGCPVVIEYKRTRDENVINQGLDYLDWLEDHRAEFRDLVRSKLGGERRVDFTAPRLLCVAGEFPRQDEVAARDSRRRIDLVRYRRYGGDFVSLEWLHGEAPPSAAASRTATKPAVSSDPPSAVSKPGYERYEYWSKTNDDTRALFHKLEALVRSFGDDVRTDSFPSELSFKRLTNPAAANAGGRWRVVAYVYLRVRTGLRLLISSSLLRGTRLDDDFARPQQNGEYREMAVHNDEDVSRAEPLLRAAYDSLGQKQDRPAAKRSPSARTGSAHPQTDPEVIGYPDDRPVD